MVFMTPDPLEGTWLPFKAELSGESAPDMALAKMRLVISAGAYSLHFGDEITDRGVYQLGAASAENRTLILVSEGGHNKGRTIPSIYQLAGDRLRICFGLGGETPASFASPSGSQTYLVSYRRKPQD